jgi:penicillin-binding protein 1A
MGRDDARSVAGLQGGTAPARAFHDFMVKAVARRPVESFDTKVPVPDWQLTAEEELYPEGVDQNGLAPLVDENGLPIGPQPLDGEYPQPQPQFPPGNREPSQQDLDQAFPPQPQPPAPQDPRSAPPPDPTEPGPGAF